VQSHFIPKTNSLKEDVHSLEKKIPIDSLETALEPTLIESDCKDSLISSEMPTDPELKLAIRYYEEIITVPFETFNYEKIANDLIVCLNSLGKIDPRTETVKYYILGCYLHLFQVHNLFSRYDPAKESYAYAIKLATELKQNDILVHLNYMMSALASIESSPDPSDKTHDNEYYLDLSIEYLNHALLIKPDDIHLLFIKAIEYTKKIKFCKTSQEKDVAYNNILCTLQKAIVEFRFNKNYNCINSDFSFINIYHQTSYFDCAVTSNIFNLKDIISTLNTEYKNFPDNLSCVQQLTIACDLMIYFFYTPDLWDELPHTLVSQAFITRIHLNKKFHPYKISQIEEDIQLLKTLDLKPKPAPNTLIEPLIKKILQEPENDSKEIKILFDTFIKIKKINNPKVLKEAIKQGEKIIKENICDNIEEKNAIKNALFYVTYVNRFFVGKTMEKINAYGVLGYAYYQHKNYKEALTQFNIAIDGFQGQFDELFFRRAKVHKELNNIEEALADCKMALNMGQLSSKTYILAGRYLKTLSELQKSNAKKAALIKAQEEQEAARTLKKLSQDKKPKNSDLFITTPDRVKKAEITIKDNLNEAILLLDFCKNEYGKVKDSKQASVTSLVDKIKNHIITIEAHVDTLKKYQDNLQEAIQSTQQQCIDKNTQKVKQYARKATDIIEKSPKQLEMVKNILNNIQKIKAQIQKEEVDTLETKIPTIKSKNKKPKTSKNKKHSGKSSIPPLIPKKKSLSIRHTQSRSNLRNTLCYTRL